MRMHDYVCNTCKHEFEKLDRQINGIEASKSVSCPECAGNVEFVMKYPSAVHCFNGPYIDSHLQKPFSTKTAMTESIKRRGLVVQE